MSNIYYSHFIFFQFYHPCLLCSLRYFQLISPTVLTISSLNAYMSALYSFCLITTIASLIKKKYIGIFEHSFDLLLNNILKVGDIYLELVFLPSFTFSCNNSYLLDSLYLNTKTLLGFFHSQLILEKNSCWQDAMAVFCISRNFSWDLVNSFSFNCSMLVDLHSCQVAHNVVSPSYSGP